MTDVPSEEPAEDYPGPGGHDTAEDVVGPDDVDAEVPD